MRYGMILFAVLLMPYMVDAGTIYHWKDEFGKTHFTDNVMLVPEQYRGDSERNLPDFEAVLAEPSAERSGQEIWQNACASCHVVGMENTPDGLVGLMPLLIDNSKTGTEIDETSIQSYQIVEIGINQALGKSHASLVSPKLSQAEVKILVLELIQMQKDALANDPGRN